MSDNPQNRRQFPRLDATLEVRLLFSVLMLDAQASATDGVQRMMVFAGHTRNLSEAGLAVVHPLRRPDAFGDLRSGLGRHQDPVTDGVAPPTGIEVVEPSVSLE